MNDRSCATCRHLRPRGLRFTATGKLIENDEFDFECAVLEVVTVRATGDAIQAGDIVTSRQARDLYLMAEPLAIRDPTRTETTPSGRLLRAGVEPFWCSAWNADPDTMPVRWEPALAFDPETGEAA